MLGKNLDCLCFLLLKMVVNNNNLTTVILYVRGTGANRYFFKMMYFWSRSIHILYFVQYFCVKQHKNDAIQEQHQNFRNESTNLTHLAEFIDLIKSAMSAGFFQTPLPQF